MKTRERIDLELLDDNPWQPRQEIDPEGLQELADSIAQVGLLQAPLGRRDTIRGHIQAGVRCSSRAAAVYRGRNRRRHGVWRCCSSARSKSSGRTIRPSTSAHIQTLADQLGIDRSTLSNNLRVLGLPGFVLEHVESGDLGLTVAREFLVLQNHDHAHVEDMQDVVREISSTYGRKGAPDWSRRHVRRLIASRVSYNEADFRPLGPRPKYHHSGAAREATFDTASFAQQLPDTLHTIPAANSLDDHYEFQCDSSRVWTCAVKEWRRRQTAATREATKESEATGGPAPAASSKSVSRDRQFEQLLAKDPVWKQVAAARAKKGPHRPVTDEEREQLGTRAAFREVGHGTRFWKRLEKADLEKMRNSYDFNRKDGGPVPPWFSDLDECRRCIIGAAYGYSRDGYPLRETALVCFNQEHYQQKLEAGEAAYRGKLAAHRKEVDRRDATVVKSLKRQLEPLSDDACQSLLLSLIAAQPALLWVNPIGFSDRDWSHESGLIELVRDLVGTESLTINGNPVEGYGTVVDVDSLPPLAPERLRQLVAALMTHHLRQADQLDTVSRETAPSPAIVAEQDAEAAVNPC